MDSIFDEYRTNADVIYFIPEYGSPGEFNRGEMTLQIHKLGGGAIGDAHEGTWLYEIHHKRKIILAGKDLILPAAATHLEAAAIAADSLANSDSSPVPYADRLIEWLDSCVSDDVHDGIEP